MKKQVDPKIYCVYAAHKQNSMPAFYEPTPLTKTEAEKRAEAATKEDVFSGYKVCVGKLSEIAKY